jgi:hypothetical protein
LEDVLNYDEVGVEGRCVIPIAGGGNPAKMSRTRPDQVEGRERIEQGLIVTDDQGFEREDAEIDSM